MNCHGCTLQEFEAMTDSQKKSVVKVCRKYDSRTIDLRKREVVVAQWFRAHYQLEQAPVIDVPLADNAEVNAQDAVDMVDNGYFERFDGIELEGEMKSDRSGVSENSESRNKKKNVRKPKRGGASNAAGLRRKKKTQPRAAAGLPEAVLASIVPPSPMRPAAVHLSKASLPRAILDAIVPPPPQEHS